MFELILSMGVRNSGHQTYPKQVNCVLSHRSAILVAAEELLHDAALNGSARAGEAARWTEDTGAILRAGQYTYLHFLERRCTGG